MDTNLQVPFTSWRLMAASVAGPSHRDGVNQDAFAISSKNGAQLFVVSDGVGSATHGGLGSSTAVASVKAQFEQLSAAVPSTELLFELAKHARNSLRDFADKNALDFYGLACTLLLHVTDADCSATLQVGDGSVVGVYENNYQRVVCALDHGSVEITSTLTGDDFPASVLTHSGKAFERLALLTDGLDAHSYDFTADTVHRPFFETLFAHMENPEYDQLACDASLTEYLRTDLVAALSGDDKTLILAQRITSNAMCPVETDPKSDPITEKSLSESKAKPGFRRGRIK